MTKLAPDPVERGLVARGKAQHDHNDRERNARRYQADLRGGGAGVVLHETYEELCHNYPLIYSNWQLRW
jgi:hypothetical protein